jgi:hypothetical protein
MTAGGALLSAIGSCVSFVAFVTDRREMAEWGTSGRLDSEVGIGPTFNCKALYASLLGRGTRSNVRLSLFVIAIQHPPPQHFSINFVPGSPISLCTSAALCEINFVEARRGRIGAGSSGSSDEEEYVREGAVDLGDSAACGSEGIQWDVVAILMARGRDILNELDRNRESMYKYELFAGD